MTLAEADTEVVVRASYRVCAGLVVDEKYRIERRLGTGGMGTVWEATHLTLGHAVALKVINADRALSAEGRRRFAVEARTAARLDSRHVARVYDNGELPNGTPYLVMELLRGQPLDRVVARGPLPLTEAATWASHLLRALAAAHQEGIIHRDVKPENVFIVDSPDDDRPIAKLLDFGIAKLTAEADGQSQTQTGTVIGTPHTMSPEQARGLRSVDHRTDIYSVGATVYTMLTGRHVFEAPRPRAGAPDPGDGEGFAALVHRICTAPLPKLRASAPHVPPAMEAWFQRACARAPEDRFGSAREALEALSAAASLGVGAEGERPRSTPPEAPRGAASVAVAPSATGSTAAAYPPLRLAWLIPVGVVLAAIAWWLGKLTAP